MMKMRIIGITGRARSGKDTIANHLVYQHNFTKVAFADPIKEGLAAMLNVTKPYLEEHKDEVWDSLGAAPREALQTLGTEWGRDIINRDIWIRLAQNKLYNFATLLVYPKIVIPDVRFNNEAAAIKSWGGTVWEVERFPEDETVSTEHSSEQGIDQELIDGWITNCVDIGSSIEALYYQVDWQLERATSEVDYDALRRFYSSHHS